MYETNFKSDSNVSPRITLKERLEIAKAHRVAKAALDACPKICYTLSTWGVSPRVEHLKSIEMYIVETVLCVPEALALLKGSHRKAFRQSMEDHFGHPIPDSYFANPLSKGYRDNLAKIIEEQGITLKQSDYKTLKDILLSLKSKLLKPVVTEAAFPNGMRFGNTEITIGKLVYSYSFSAGRKPRIKWDQGRKAVHIASLFELMVDAYGEPMEGRPQLFNEIGLH